MSCEDLKPVGAERQGQEVRVAYRGEAGNRMEKPESCKPETSLPSAMQPVRRTVDGGHR